MGAASSSAGPRPPLQDVLWEVFAEENTKAAAEHRPEHNRFNAAYKPLIYVGGRRPFFIMLHD